MSEIHPKIAKVAVGIGSNLGLRNQLLLNAQREILKLPLSRNFIFSSIYSTVSIGGQENAPAYLNATVIFDTELSPHDLLNRLLQIENLNARVRSYRNAPRTLDLDLLLYGNTIISDEVLTVPHPRMQDRFFVLTPLAEIYSQCVHPLLQKTIKTLEEDLMLKSEKDKFIRKTDSQFESGLYK